MRILIISDVHANLTALEAVLADAGEVEATWCLGDLVGYGPDPNECIARVRRLTNLTCIQGPAGRRHCRMRRHEPDNVYRRPARHRQDERHSGDNKAV